TIISVIPNLSDNKCFFICFKVILSTAKSSINASISAFSPNNNKTSLCSKYVEAFGVMVVLDSNLGIRPFSVLSIETTVILYLFVSCNSFNCFPFKGECGLLQMYVIRDELYINRLIYLDLYCSQRYLLL